VARRVFWPLGRCVVTIGPVIFLLWRAGLGRKVWAQFGFLLKISPFPLC